MTRITDVPIGSLISFRSKNPSDEISWRGTLESIGGYRSIAHLGSTAPYHQATRQSDPTIPISETDLTYFLITVDNSSSVPTLRVFASEWIEEGSLAQISLGTKVTIEVMDHLNNSQTILSLLASAGYATKIVPNR